MSGYVLALVACVTIVFSIVFLLRRRRLKEKYAGIWLTMAVAVVIVGAFPELAFWLARFFGVALPSNLVFAVAILVLFIVVIHLSVELSGAEEETRTLAEEVALLRLDVLTLTEATQAQLTSPITGGATNSVLVTEQYDT